MVLADCTATKLQAKVELRFFNKGWKEKSINYHFGADEQVSELCIPRNDSPLVYGLISSVQGLYEMTMFFFGMYSLGFFAMVGIVRNFVQHNIMHEIHWLMVSSYVCFLLAHMLRLIHFIKFAKDGLGTEWITIFSRSVPAVSATEGLPPGC